jgi:hypothetical protein
MLFADLVWPALFLEGRLLTWWAIGAGLIAEFLVLRFWLKLSLEVAVVADIVMNVVSTIAGIVLIPAAGVAWEYFPGQFLNSLLNVGTFNPLAWTVTCLFAALLNSLIEGTVLRSVFGIEFRKMVFVALFVGNTVSVALAMGSLLVAPPEG